MNKSLKTLLQYLFFLGLGVLFVWLSLKNLNKENLDEINKALRNARYWLVVPVLVILVLSHLVRASRWKLLIEPLGYSPSTVNCFLAVMIGYLVNQGVPRLGEVVKCTILGRYEKIPMEKLIGTVILERVIDGLSLLTILGITLMIQPKRYTQLMNSFFSHGETGETNSLPAYVYLLALILILVLLTGLWMLVKRKTVKDVAALGKKIAMRVWEGISSVQHLKKRGLFIFYTVLLWSLYLFAGYIGLFALQETSGYGIREAFTILSAGSIGMIASPGGIGAYAYLIQKTMPVYGLHENIALAFGWILWLVTTIVIVLGGLISFAAIPYYNKKYKSEKSRSHQQ